MADNRYAALSEFLAQPMPQAEAPRSNALVSGLSAGVDQLQQLGGAALGAVGQLSGIDSLRDYGTQVYRDNAAQIANSTGRPDLEGSFPISDPGKIIPWITYQTAKNLPQIAATALVARKFGPQLAGMVPEAAATAAARAPTWLGGGGLRAGMTAAEQAAAMTTGRELVAGAAAAAPVNYPFSVGSIYGQAIDRGDPNAGDAAFSFAAGVPYAFMESFAPAKLERFMAKGAEGNLFQRVATRALGTAPIEGITEGAQTGIEMMERPDLSIKEKAQNIVDAAVTGGIVGGVLGGASGIRKIKSVDAARTSNDDLKGAIDEITGQYSLPGVAQPPAASQVYDAKTQALRPLANTSDEELQKGFAAIQQRSVDAQSADEYARMFGGAPQARTNPDDMLLAEQIRREMDLRQQEAPPQATVGPDRQTGMDLFSNAGVPLQDQRAPSYVEQANEADKVDENVAATRSWAAETLPARSKVAKDLIANTTAATQEDFIREAVGKINELDNAGVDLPADLRTFGRNIGLFDSEGNPRDLDAEVAQARQRSELLWQRAKQTGRGQSEAVAYQNKTLADLVAMRDRLNRALTEPQAATDNAQQNEMFEGQPASDTTEAAPKEPTAREIWEEEFGYNPKPMVSPGTTAANAQNQLAAVQQRALEGQSMPSDMLRAQQARTALDNRDAARGPQPESRVGQLDLFGRRTPPDVTRFTPVQKQVMEWSKGNTPVAQDFAAKLNNATEAGAIRAIADEIEQRKQAGKKLPQSLINMGEAVGLLDETGNPAQLQAQVEFARQTLQAKWRQAQEQGSNGSEAQAYQRDVVKPLEQKYQRLQAAMATNAQLQTAPVATQTATDQGRFTRSNVTETTQAPVTQTPAAQTATQAPVTQAPVTQTTATQPTTQAPQAPVTQTTATQPTTQAPVTQAPVTQTTAPAAAPTQQEAVPAKSERSAKKAEPKTLKEAVVAYDNARDVAKWLARNAPDEATRVIVRKLLPALDNTFFRLVRPGDTVPTAAAQLFNNNANGVFFSRYATGERAIFVLEGKWNDSTVLHELIHAATDTRLREGNKVGNANTPLGKIVSEFYDLQKAVVEHFNALMRSNNNPSITSDTQVRAAVSSVEEMATYALTNEKVREYFKTIPYKNTNAFSKFVSTLRKLFGVAEKHQNAFTALIDMTERLTETKNPVSTKPLEGFGYNPSDTASASLQERAEDMNQSSKNLMETVNNALKYMSELRKKTTWREWSLEFNRWHLYTSSTANISEFFGSPFRRADGSNVLADWVKKQLERRVIQQRLAHLVRAGYLDYETAAKNKPEAGKLINKLMQYSAYEIDPRKGWAEQTWLHGRKNEDGLIKLTQQANQELRKLRQISPEGGKAYDNFIATNEAHYFIQQALSLYNMIRRDAMVPQEFKDRLVNPMTKFLSDEEVYDSPQATRQYWMQATSSLMDSVNTLIADQTGQNILNEAERAKVSSSSKLLRKRVGEILREQDAMQRAPYFHIARFGDYVLKLNVRKGADGKADPAVLERIAKTLDDIKIRNIVIPKEFERPNLFMRFDNLTSRDEAMRAMMQLESQGLVDNVQALRRSDEINTEEASYQIPESVQSLMDSMRGAAFGETLDLDEQGNAILAKIKRELRNHITQHFMNQLPDTANSKVMTHRNYVAGFSDDFARAYVFRTEIASRAIASLATAADMADLSEAMTRVTKDLRRSPDTQAAMVAQMTANELMLREAQRPTTVRNKFFDFIRAFTHTMFLGLSPGYVVTQMTAVPTTLWPELSKKYGYVASAKAIARVTPTANKILTAVLAEGGKSGWKNLPDATINRKVLERAGVTGATAEFVIRFVNAGGADIGTQSRELGRVAEGTESSKSEQLLRWGAAAGYYSELYTRTLAALAAREAHGGTGDEMFNYAMRVVDQSMPSFDPDNAARATGPTGVLGQATPLVAQFQSYMYRMTEKLMREMYTAFRDNAKSPEEKAEARKYMYAHLAGMAMVSGTLGLPMMSVFSMLLDRAVDWLGDDDDEPFNSQIALRNWLNEMFGDGVGNVIARGVPRAVGFDISKRVGEQDMLPFLQIFSKFLTDRRNREDAFKEWLSSSVGSSLGLAGNMLDAYDAYGQGDFMGAAAKMSPAVIRGPLMAAGLYNKGYTDSKGNKQPMTVSGADVVYQTLGLTPAKKADLTEQNAAQASMRGDMLNKARAIRDKLIAALEDGDMDTARAWAQRAAEFDAANPTRQILPGLDEVLSARLRERNNAAARGTPLGVKRGDEAYTSFFTPQ